MFYDIFKKLCNDRRETPNAVCLKLGLSQATAPYWKKSGKAPKRETLEKIAEYFGVSIEYLLGREPTVADVFGRIEKNIADQKENAPAQYSRSELFFILGKLTDSELDDLLEYAQFLISKRQNQTEQANQ